MPPPPLAVADAATIAADSVGNSIAVLANDIDASGSGLTVTAVSELVSLPPASGASVSSDGSVVSYTPLGIGAAADRHRRPRHRRPGAAATSLDVGRGAGERDSVAA